jgi:hypothetical protein
LPDAKNLGDGLDHILKRIMNALRGHKCHPRTPLVFSSFRLSELTRMQYDCLMSCQSARTSVLAVVGLVSIGKDKERNAINDSRHCRHQKACWTEQIILYGPLHGRSGPGFWRNAEGHRAPETESPDQGKVDKVNFEPSGSTSILVAMSASGAE